MSESGWVYYFILLLAVASGWMLAKASDWRLLRGFASRNTYAGDYFIGLNYLLHDEPDEAVDTFIKALELNPDTMETHLALGILLRRRGKVDKAIEVHQNLLAGKELSESHSLAIRLELARDFTAAGVLDRAELVLQGIVDERSVYRWEALNQLILIYQTSKEWRKAEAAARELLVNPAYRQQQGLRSAASHYCCELAQESLRDEDAFRFRRWLAKAWSYDRRNVRPALMLAEAESASGNHRRAARMLMKAAGMDMRFLPEIVAPLGDSLLAVAATHELESFLVDANRRHPSTAAALLLAQLQKSTSGTTGAISHLSESQTRHPTLRGLVAMSELIAEAAEGEQKDRLITLHGLLRHICALNPGFLCGGCGFTAKRLYWLCPGCQQWGMIAPVGGPAGD